jgi:hypothetical protein
MSDSKNITPIVSVNNTMSDSKNITPIVSVNNTMSDSKNITSIVSVNNTMSGEEISSTANISGFLVENKQPDQSKNKYHQMLLKSELMQSLFEEDLAEILPNVTIELFDFLIERNLISISKVTFKIYKDACEKGSIGRASKLLSLGYMPGENDLIDLINGPIFNLDLDSENKVQKLNSLDKRWDFKGILFKLEGIEKIILNLDQEHFVNVELMRSLVRKITGSSIQLKGIATEFVVSSENNKKIIELNSKHISVMKLLIDNIMKYA